MSGWGRLGDSQPWSRFLRAAPVDIVRPETCNRNVRVMTILYGEIFLTPSCPALLQLAGAAECLPRAGLCRGPGQPQGGLQWGLQGGPLVGRDSQGRWAAVGLVRQGGGGANNGLKGVSPAIKKVFLFIF